MDDRGTLTMSRKELNRLQILNRVLERRLTQAKAAEMLGVSQSRVSDLTRGKWERFSLEMLIILATKAGMRIVLKRAA